MGCGGFELYPAPAEVVSSVNAVAAAHGVRIDSVRLLKSMIAEDYARIPTPGAGKPHLNRGTSIIKPERTPKKSNAPTFSNSPSSKAGSPPPPGGWICSARHGSPLKNDLPRMIFISDMGDAMSTKGCSHSSSRR
jgi:hypothetical protein